MFKQIAGRSDISPAVASDHLVWFSQDDALHGLIVAQAPRQIPDY